MIYLPSQFGRWWIVPELGVKQPSRWHKRIGWWSDDIRQATFDEYLEVNEYQFTRAMQALIPLEIQVYEALGFRDMSQHELEYITASYQQDLVPHQTCTMRTALNRLMRQGKITRVLHSRGWFQWYVYIRKAD